ncbi:hypothetical protein Catovirus_2_160 [Catovirus CTV1]|uniref:Uncharacterized protein n=1 Tax=Catovirus CTV1 TaxID=1977631 RepID=A0A1V0SC05_9VIRU|nr:hypothetical protein Catovirus_2_160 [Catovirus CTV1]
MAETNIPNNINLGDNIAKNVKFNINPEQFNNAMQQLKQPPQFNNNTVPPQFNNNVAPPQFTNNAAPPQFNNNIGPQQFTNNVGPQQFNNNVAPKSILKENIKMPTPQNTVAPPPVAEAVSTVLGDYYSIFGFQLSKTTIYIFIAFVALVVAYIIYSKWFSSPPEEKKKKKKNSEVSFKEQEKTTQDE